MRFKCLLFLLPLAIVFNSCDETVSTSLPEYELNLSVEVEYNSVVVKLSTVGNIDISDISLALNDSVLSTRFLRRDKIIWGHFKPDDQIIKAQNELELRYQHLTQAFTFDIENIYTSRLDTSAADSLIDGRIYREPNTDFEISWINMGNPDFYIFNARYEQYDRETREYISYHKQFVTSDSFVTLPASFNPNRTLWIYIGSCWGPKPNEQGYSNNASLPVNFRKCSNLYTEI